MPRFSDCWRCGNTVGIGIVCQLCDVAKYCSEKCQKNDIFRHESECIPASILKTCTACRKSGPNLKACTGCYRVFYCDANCQRSNWERHKIDCLEVKQKIETTTGRILAKYFSPFGQTFSMYYYWGNVPAFDCLNLVENEGTSYGSALKVLILGVGDLRNVALTCASLPDSYENKILFTLNDKESCVLARLVLFLYMLKKGALGIEKTVTEIWYSILLSEATYQYLRVSLQELISITSAEHLQSKTAGLISVHEMHFKQLQDVWKGWLQLWVQGTKWIQKQRVEVMNMKVQFVKRIRGYIENIPVEHANAARKWINDGVFKRTQTPVFAENPTLTGVNLASRNDPYSYSLPPEPFPFSGWDYLQVKKFKSSNCLVTMYGDYIECILRSFMKRLSKQQVSFQIVLSDCVSIQQHIEMDTVYDRILTSNLMDYVFLPDLLKLCSKMLNHNNHHATIITETISWALDRGIMPEGDVQFPANQPQIPMLTKIAFEDTKRSSLAGDGAIGIREYLENSSQFFDCLRALFYANRLRTALGNGPSKDKSGTIPVTKEVGNEFQLRLRDVIRNENRIVFFRPAINRRRVTIVTGMERYLEWVPLQKK